MSDELTFQETEMLRTVFLLLILAQVLTGQELGDKVRGKPLKAQERSMWLLRKGEVKTRYETHMKSVSKESQNPEKTPQTQPRSISNHNSTTHTVMLGSQGNSIELLIVNKSPVDVSEISVKPLNPPSWIRFLALDEKFSLNAEEQKPALFTFAVENSAPVGKEVLLSFAVRTGRGESWNKEVKIQVAPPQTFELFQNYPNPFNPRTTIAYQLPSNGKITLKVFNVLGQEVAKLVEMEKQAGYYQESFEAGHLASGVYIYRLIYTLVNGKLGVVQKKMVVMK